MIIIIGWPGDLQVRLAVKAWLCSDSGKVVHIHVFLISSSIIWYRQKCGDALQFERLPGGSGSYR